MYNQQVHMLRVADPATGHPHLVAILCMTNFYRTEGVALLPHWIHHCILRTDSSH